MGITSLNGVVLPIITATFTATANPNTFRGIAHNDQFITFDNSLRSDFSNLDGIIDLTTGETSGAVSGPGIAVHFTVFDNITVDYSNSTAPVSIDLTSNPQQGGFAQGDVLTNVAGVIGSPFNDVIKGQDTMLDDRIINDPGENQLFGRAGDDILEGRGGPDLINGGPGNDTASYSPHLRLSLSQ